MGFSGFSKAEVSGLHHQCPDTLANIHTCDTCARLAKRSKRIKNGTLEFEGNTKGNKRHESWNGVELGVRRDGKVNSNGGKKAEEGLSEYVLGSNGNMLWGPLSSWIKKL